jgi:pimeloyl-ACP methyl ester carboxylesterase
VREAAYDIDGPADGPSIVFVHATRLSRSMWRAQMDDLRDAYRVIAVDLPGHGRLADRRFTLAGAADAVADTIETAGGGHAVVVGLSLGGYVAIDLAARRPQLVRGLVLAGATAEPVGAIATPYRALAWVMDRFDGPALDAFNAWFFRTRFPPAVSGPIIAGGFWSAAGAQALRAIVGERFQPRLAGYAGSTLILNGEWDALFRLGAGGFARAAQDARRVRLRGATHLANLDRPGAFSLAVRRFVESLPPRDQAPGEPHAGRRKEGPVLDLADSPRVP